MIPDLQTLGGNGLSFFHLGPEEGGDQFAGEVGGADVDPGVLVDLAAEELAAVGALFTDDFSTVSKGRVVDQQGAAFAGDDVLGFMERVAAQISNRSQRTPFVGSHHPLGRVFDHQQVMVAGDRHDRVHLASHTGVVDRHDRLGAGGDRRLNQPFIDVEGVFADVNEDRHPSTKHEGVGRGHKGIGGHDDLIPRLDVGKDGGHLQRCRAGVGEQGLVAAGLIFQPGVALFGEVAIACKLTAGMGLGDVMELLTGEVGLVERNHSLRANSRRDPPAGNRRPSRRSMSSSCITRYSAAFKSGLILNSSSGL